MPNSDESLLSSNPDIAAFVRSRREDILREWERRVRELPAAQKLERSAIIDHIPRILDQVAAHAENVARDAPLPKSAAADHARERLGEGFDVAQVILEFTALRDAALRLFEEERTGSEKDLRSARILGQAVDQAIIASVDRFVSLRDRVLETLDRISRASLESPELDTLLTKLLEVLLETMEVDTAGILVRDGQTLQGRVSIGLGRDDDATRGLSFRVGEGFLGTIASSGRPLLVKDAQHDPLVHHELLKRQGVRGLFGVPLMGTMNAPVGVAYVGSRRAGDFSDEVKQLLTFVSHRTAALIAQHLLIEKLERYSQDLEKAAAVRNSMMHEREELLAIVSHDLRSPLNIIRLGAMVARTSGEVKSETTLRSLDSIQRAVDRMDYLIRSLLDMASIQAGKLSLEPRRCPVADLVQEAVTLYEPLAQEKAIKILREIRAGADVRCDRDRMLQAFSNLMGNAIKFCRPAETIQVLVDLKGNEVQFEIRDSGPGIRPDDLPHIFEPYWSGATPSKKEGVGLGLYITKGIIEAHGGRIWAESQLGVGTSVLFTLPIASDS